MGILADSSNSQNFIKSNNKIPEYARDYKKEYLFIIGIDKEFKYFVEHINESPTGLFENHRVDRIKYFIKRFLKGQERGKLKDISNFILKKNDILYIEEFYQNMIYNFEEDDNSCYRNVYMILNYIEEYDKLGDREFCLLLCEFYNKLKVEFFVSDYYGEGECV